MKEQKIFYAEHIADFLARPVLGGDILQLAKEKVEVEYWTEVLCANWHKFRDQYAYLFKELLKKKSWVSLLTSKLLFLECSSVTDSVEIFLNLVCDPLLTKKKEGKAFRELLKKVLMKIWHVIGFTYDIKFITFLDVNGLTISLSPGIKIGAYTLVFPSFILLRKEEEVTRTILHEVSHTLRPTEMEIDGERFANEMADLLLREIDFKEGKFR